MFINLCTIPRPWGHVVLNGKFLSITGAPKGNDAPFTTDRRRAGLQVTRAGLYTVYYGICAVLFAMGVGSLLGILGIAMNLAIVAILAGLLSVVAGLGGYIAILVGQCMCLTVPRESGGKGHVQIAVAIQVFSILLFVGGVVMTVMLEASGNDTVLLESVLQFVNAVMVLVGYVCFLRFIKNVAVYIQRNDLASSSSKVMRMVVVVGLMLCLFPVIEAFVGGMDGAIVYLAVSLIVLIAFLITFIRYANLVAYLAQAIPK